MCVRGGVNVYNKTQYKIILLSAVTSEAQRTNQ